MKPTSNPTTRALRTAIGTAATVALFALPVLAQTPAGIPGVVAAGVEPELVQEGFVFTEGPVASPTAALFHRHPSQQGLRARAGRKIALIREQSTGATALP